MTNIQNNTQNLKWQDIGDRASGRHVYFKIAFEHFTLIRLVQFAFYHGVPSGLYAYYYVVRNPVPDEDLEDNYGHHKYHLLLHETSVSEAQDGTLRTVRDKKAFQENVSLELRPEEFDFLRKIKEHAIDQLTYQAGCLQDLLELEIYK